MVVVPSANMMRDASFMYRPSARRHCGGQRLAIDPIRAQIEAAILGRWWRRLICCWCAVDDHGFDIFCHNAKIDRQLFEEIALLRISGQLANEFAVLGF